MGVRRAAAAAAIWAALAGAAQAQDGLDLLRDALTPGGTAAEDGAAELPAARPEDGAAEPPAARPEDGADAQTPGAPPAEPGRAEAGTAADAAAPGLLDMLRGAASGGEAGAEAEPGADGAPAAGDPAAAETEGDAAPRDGLLDILRGDAGGQGSGAPAGRGPAGGDAPTDPARAGEGGDGAADAGEAEAIAAETAAETGQGGTGAADAAAEAGQGGSGGLLDLLKGAAGGGAPAAGAGEAPSAGQSPPGETVVPEPATPPSAGGPLKRADLPELDRRVLTLPGAALAPDPGAESSPLPAFSVRYVFAEEDRAGDTWLAVGGSAAGGPEGWVRAADTEDWRTMLVMQYAPKGNRNRVLFFKRRNDLVQFVRDPYVAEEARFAYEAIEAGDHDGDYFVAIEPAVDVAPDKAYLMPILDSREEMFDSLEEVKLLEVAGLTAEAATPQTDISESESLGAPRRHSSIRDFRFGIVFAIDTTITMGRQIEETRAAVVSVIRAFSEAGLAEKVDFGLVGYRDNTGPDPQIEYVTRMFQPLEPGAGIDQVLANFRLMTPAPVSTKDFDEDAFAGLDLAINGMDWAPYDLRMVVLITDAGARRGTDPMAANPGYDALNIVENAARKDVALSVLHILTPQAAEAGNIAPAREVYARIAATGDAATPKYFPLDATDSESFRAAMGAFTGELVEAVSTAARGRRVEPAGQVAGLGDALVNEVFRAQLEYLGAAQGQAAPRFARAWAADTDLVDQTTRALSVKVFLTRQQLSALMEGAEAILSAYERQETGGGDFFDQIRAFSAQASVEGAGSRPVERAADLFPSFLAALPYRSDFLELDADSWSMGGPSLQRELTATLESKLAAYRDIAASREGWIDLGSGVRAEDVYPVSLDLLP